MKNTTAWMIRTRRIAVRRGLATDMMAMFIVVVAGGGIQSQSEAGIETQTNPDPRTATGIREEWTITMVDQMAADQTSTPPRVERDPTSMKVEGAMKSAMETKTGGMDHRMAIVLNIAVATMNATATVPYPQRTATTVLAVGDHTIRQSCPMRSRRRVKLKRANCHLRKPPGKQSTSLKNIRIPTINLGTPGRKKPPGMQAASRRRITLPTINPRNPRNSSSGIDYRTDRLPRNPLTSPLVALLLAQ
jgi:hypothetical protein